MTPEALEAAARELCRIRSVDAEKEFAPGFTAWQHAAIEVRRFVEIGTAIAAVTAKAPRKRKEKTSCEQKEGPVRLASSDGLAGGPVAGRRSRTQ